VKGDPEQRPANRPAPVGTVDAPVDCIGCGYQLRGLPAEGACPECATAIWRSVRGDLLRDADPDWLARVRRGVSLIARATTFFLLLYLVLFATIFVSAFAPGLSHAMTFVVTIGVVLQILLLLAWIAGVRILTTREPNREDGIDPIDRRAARIAAMCVIGMAALVLVTTLTAPLIPPASVAPVILTTIEVVAVWALGFAVASLMYFSLGVTLHLADRLPNRKLFRRARSVRRLIVGIGIAAPTFAFTTYLLGAGAVPGGASVIIGGMLGLLGLFAVIGSIGAALEYAAVFGRLRRELRRLRSEQGPDRAPPPTAPATAPRPDR